MGEESAALRADIEERRESMSGTIDAIEDKIVPSRIISRRREALKDWGSGVKSRVMGTAESASGRASSTADKMSERVSAASDAVSHAPAQVQQATAGSPLIAGAIAFGIGALIAALIPETEVEQRAAQAAQPHLAAATDAVKEAGQQALETAKSSAHDAAQELKESATSHAHDVADEAKEAGQQVKETAANARSD